MSAIRILFVLLLAGLLGGCGYNAIQSKDEGVKAAWSEVLNQYQRRADLVPNLVNTVKGYATHEEDVLVKVTEARAQVGKITLITRYGASKVRDLLPMHIRIVEGSGRSPEFNHVSRTVAQGRTRSLEIMICSLAGH